jgi:hypothetical protein
MKFSELKFDNLGCCDTHGAWAAVQHENGRRTEVHDIGGGAYRVVTFIGQVIATGALDTSDTAAIEARIASDAA